MADENANRRQRTDVTAGVSAVMAEPALASLARAGAPVVVAEADPPRAIHANDAALAFFGVGDCGALTTRLFGAQGPGPRLAELAGSLTPGAAARLERLDLNSEVLPGCAMVLCRLTAGDVPLFVLAVLGLRAGSLTRPCPAAAAAEPVAPPNLAGVDAQTDHQENLRQDQQERRLEASALEALRARLQERFPGLAPARFLWRTDARNIVVQLTPPLAEIVGPGCADLVGRDVLEAAQALGLDPRGEFAEALRARVTFSRVDLDWPIEQASAAAPVTLGALPAFDHGDNFEGWRGFGVVHLDRLHAAPFVAGPFRQEEPAAARKENAASVESVAGDSPPTGVVTPTGSSGVVVHLRPLVQPRPAPAETSAAPQGRGDGDDDSALVALSPHERSAFREIARALGARTAGGAIEEEVSAEAPAESPQTAESSEGQSEWVSACDLAEALPVGLVVVRDELPLYANRVVLDWLGCRDLAAFREAGGLRTASRFAGAGLAPGQKRTLLLRAATGEAFSADVHCQRLQWRGAPAMVYVLARPSVTALEQRLGVQEASLRQRETEIEEIQSMLDAAADGVVLINSDGAILGLDRGAEALLEYDRNQVAGENFTLLLTRESHVSALEHFTRAKAGAEKRGREAIGRTRQGATFPLHLTIGRLGKAVEGKYCLILRDLSHWRQTERAMEEARARAERDSQAKSEFLAKVSHEIRTPLNAILGFAEVIMDERFGPVGNERYRDYLRDIHASGSHVMSLVNDLLDLSKIEAGKQELNFTAVDANRIVSECVSLIQPQANRERVITRLALASRLPPILADERSLRQIVLNLLANAVRYNEPGGQVIVSTALSESGHAVLRVKDTGVGMSESELRTALEPFRQVAPARGGTGLGLPLTKALAEANGAGFSIKSRKNEGTLVEVVFPLAPGATESVSAGGKTR